MERISLVFGRLTFYLEVTFKRCMFLGHRVLTNIWGWLVHWRGLLRCRFPCLMLVYGGLYWPGVKDLSNISECVYILQGISPESVTCQPQPVLSFTENLLTIRDCGGDGPPPSTMSTSRNVTRALLLSNRPAIKCPVIAFSPKVSSTSLRCTM